MTLWKSGRNTCVIERDQQTAKLLPFQSLSPPKHITNKQQFDGFDCSLFISPPYQQTFILLLQE